MALAIGLLLAILPPSWADAAMVLRMTFDPAGAVAGLATRVDDDYRVPIRVNSNSPSASRSTKR